MRPKPSSNLRLVRMLVARLSRITNPGTASRIDLLLVLRSRSPLQWILVAFIASVLLSHGEVGAGVIERVSVNSGGLQTSGFSSAPSLSYDGRIVLFYSEASDLVIGDTNGAPDAFVHDRQTGSTTRVSVNSAGFQGNGGAYALSLSGDGRFVAFRSFSNNLAPGADGHLNLFIHDRDTAVTSLLMTDSAGADVNVGGTFNTSGTGLSADGRFVLFDSLASNLVPGDTNGVVDVFVLDRLNGAITRVSVSSSGAQANGQSWRSPTISDDGRFVAFSSDASNLVMGDTNGVRDVFVHDLETGETSRVSVSTTGGEANSACDPPSISGDGRFVAFSTQSSNLVPGDTNGTTDVFVHDRLTGITSRISINSSGMQANDASVENAISGDGRFVAFRSNARNLVPGDTNGLGDVFVHDRQTGVTTRLSIDSNGIERNGEQAFGAAISGNGVLVAFVSDATNLVPGDTNGQYDVFVATRAQTGLDLDLDGHVATQSGGDDCDDANPLIFLGATEICDLKDNNCNGAIDETFAQGCDVAAADTDGDALRDKWEVLGYDANGDGIPEVDLPRMGAHPLRKDVFVEVDYMEETSGTVPHSDQFSLESYRRVQQAYLNAPVLNPDGSAGISLHVDAGPTSIMNPRTGEVWGSLSRSSAVGHRTDVSLQFVRDAAAVNEGPYRSRIFHYGVAAHNLTGTTDPSCDPPVLVRFNGQGQGRHLIVTQGATEGQLVALGGFIPGVRDVVQEAGLFMHELGHSMGLAHGGAFSLGSVSNANRKPHYFSVMNYSFSYRGLNAGGKYGRHDYSRFDLTTLDEDALQENLGLGANAPAHLGTIRYCAVNHATSLNCVPQGAGVVVAEANAAVPMDWDCDGAIASALTSSDINIDSREAFANFKVLNASNDWSRLVYNAYGAIGGAATEPVPSAPAAIDEPTDEQLEALLPKPVAVDVAGQGVKVRPPGHSELYEFAVLNDGENPDTYSLIATSSAGIADLSSVPSMLSLQPGEVGVVRVVVVIPSTAVRGTRDVLSLRAESRENPRMVAIGTTITLVSDVRPIASAGPDQTIVGRKVVLDGSASFSPSGAPLRFVWTGPFNEGSGLVYEKNATVTLLTSGTQVITLVVNDGVIDSEPDSLVVTATNYNFAGFFPPVDNEPVLNTGKAGAGVPVKFSLGGNQGLNIFASGYPRSATILCDGTAPADFIEETVTAGGSGLTYDAVGNQYVYVWKTDRAWADTCRQLVLRLKDSTEHKANFKFKK